MKRRYPLTPAGTVVVLSCAVLAAFGAAECGERLTLGCERTSGARALGGGDRRTWRAIPGDAGEMTPTKGSGRLVFSGPKAPTATGSAAGPSPAHYEEGPWNASMSVTGAAMHTPSHGRGVEPTETGVVSVSSDLAYAIVSMPSTGRPSLATATAWAARILETCASVDPWLVVALARAESGFRPDARERGGAGPGVGLFQMHRAYTAESVALDPMRAIPAACDKLRYWRSHCGDAVWLACWFAGWKRNEGARASARKVLALAEEWRP